MRQLTTTKIRTNDNVETLNILMIKQFAALLKKIIVTLTIATLYSKYTGAVE